jgi:hypothetical protein
LHCLLVAPLLLLPAHAREEQQLHCQCRQRLQGLLLPVQWWQLYQAHLKVACLPVLLGAHHPHQHQTLLLLLLLLLLQG